MEGTEDNSLKRNTDNKPKGSIPNALLLLSIGAILLLNNFGLISWDIWNFLWKFWPVIFVFWGFREISENSWFLKLIFNLISLLMIAFAVIYSLALSNSSFRNWLELNYPVWTKILQVQPTETLEINTV